MRTKLFDHEAVHFVAGRIFPHGGRMYYPGEVVEDARDWRNVEALVRSRHLWPVAEDPSVLPIQMRKDVKSVEFARHRLRADTYLDHIQMRDEAPEPEVEEAVTPAFNREMTNKQLLAYLDEHPQDIKNVLELARELKRTRLVRELEERLAVPDEEEIDV